MKASPETPRKTKIINAGFVKSVVEFEKGDQHILSEVCFVGRSNVGKSSLINTLLGRKIARTSSTPGATRLINIFNVTYELNGARGDVVFSDCPGFGYAKVSRAESQNWKRMIEGYILKNKGIRQIVWVFDVRRQMDELDMLLMEWFADNALSFCLVLTKTDKEKQGDVVKKERALQSYLKGVPLFLFSSKTGKGRSELLSHIINVTGPVV